MASLVRQRMIVCQCSRSFSTSSRRTVSLQWDKNNSEALAAVLPPYPYGPTLLYKQSRLGLYGGQRIRFGNNRGEKFNTRTRRTFKPNILTRRLFSKALNRHVQVRVSARVLRTIDKLGGLDEYLLGEKAQRIKELGESGWWLRWAVMQTPAVKNRYAQQRSKLGLDVLDRQMQAMSLVSEATEDIRDSEIYSAMESDGPDQIDLKTAEEYSADTSKAGKESTHSAGTSKSVPSASPADSVAAALDDSYDPYKIISNLDLAPKIRPNSKRASKFRLIDGKWYYRVGLAWRPWQPKPFRFRVGRGKHVYLSANGWRRSRPDSTNYMMQAQEGGYRNFVDGRVRRFIEELDASMAKMPAEDRFTQSESLQLVKEARAEIYKEYFRRLESNVVEMRKAVTRRRLARRTEKNRISRAEEAAKQQEEGRNLDEQITIM